MHHSQCNEGTHSSISFDFESLEFLAIGKSGIVYGIDEGKILKEYHGEEKEIEVERRAFARLGSHANIVRYLGATGKGSIVLERGQPLRTVNQQTGADQILLDRKLRWLSGAAEGMRYMHQNGIIHADVGCHNMILVQDCLKIIDFEGCSIDGEEATSCYEWFSYQESTPAISQKTDIFAYGCAVYEIMTGRPPHHELATSDDRRRLVKRLYAENRFPKVTDLPLGELMQGCWHGTFNSMSEVLQALEAARLPIASRVDARLTAFCPLDLIANFSGVFCGMKNEDNFIENSQ
jgi:serine/threonine protein kinase